jgi:hypothetical protein
MDLRHDNAKKELCASASADAHYGLIVVLSLLIFHNRAADRRPKQRRHHFLARSPEGHSNTFLARMTAVWHSGWNQNIVGAAVAARALTWSAIAAAVSSSSPMRW